jgi:hypothetical protein
MQIEKCNGLIGNRTRDLLAYNIVLPLNRSIQYLIKETYEEGWNVEIEEWKR